MSANFQENNAQTQTMDNDNDDDTNLLILLLFLSYTFTFLSFHSFLSLGSQRRRKGTVRCGALLPPQASAFTALFNSGQDDALITLCGFDHASFTMLLGLFKPLYDNLTPYSKDGMISDEFDAYRGRPRCMDACTCLALCLAWTRTRGSLAVLCIIFGITSSTLSLWIRFSRRIVIHMLLDHPLAKVAMPTFQELLAYRDLIQAKYPALQTEWGAMDGLKVRCHMSGDNSKQNYFFNGWLHGHYVTNLLLFSPDGLVRACYLNSPGTTHDSSMANYGGVYGLVDDVYAHYGLRIVADSAFARDQRASILPSYQTNFDRNGRFRQNPALFRAATSLRQLSEWGMRGFQASFPRLKDPLMYEERGERKVILQMMVLLYNFRASTVGQNEIQSSFMASLERDANEYLFGDLD